MSFTPSWICSSRRPTTVKIMMTVIQLSGPLTAASPCVGLPTLLIQWIAGWSKRTRMASSSGRRPTAAKMKLPVIPLSSRPTVASYWQDMPGHSAVKAGWTSGWLERTRRASRSGRKHMAANDRIGVFPSSRLPTAVSYWQGIPIHSAREERMHG